MPVWEKERISKDCDLYYLDFSLLMLTFPFSIAFSTSLILTRALGKLNNPSLAGESILQVFVGLVKGIILCKCGILS